MRSITRLVMGFVQSRSGAVQVNLNEVLGAVLDIFEPMAKDVFISIVRKLDPELPTVHGSGADLEQGMAHMINDICLGQVGPADLIVRTLRAAGLYATTHPY